MKVFKTNYLILSALVLLFATPGIAAYLFYTHPQWLGAATTNKGRLLAPAELITAMPAKPKWRLILWSPKDCQDRCLSQLDKLARIRLALGRRLYEVDQWLLIGEETPPLSTPLSKAFAEQDIHVLRLTKQGLEKAPSLQQEAQVFIANPRNYLVLSFDLEAKPEHIFHDLKQLLATTEKQSG